MAAAPAFTAVLADVLWCLGIGCLLGAGRDLLALVLGNGPVRCFCLDVLTFAAAAVLVCGFSAGVSASGVARWYMAAAMLAGVLAWGKGVQPAVHRLVRALTHAATYPFVLADRALLRPLRSGIAARARACRRRKMAKKEKKKPKNGKKQLQRPSKIVYN